MSSGWCWPQPGAVGTIGPFVFSYSNKHVQASSRGSLKRAKAGQTPKCKCFKLCFLYICKYCIGQNVPPKSCSLMEVQECHIAKGLVCSNNLSSSHRLFTFPLHAKYFRTPIKRVTPKCSLFLQTLISTHLLIPFYCFLLSHQHFFSFLRVLCVPVFCIWSHLPPGEVVEISGQLIQEKT